MTVDDSFNRTIASSTNDSILWLFSDEVLFIGCTDSVWRAKASNNSAGMSNTDIDLKRQIETKYKTNLSNRQLDNVLIEIANKKNGL